MGVLKVLMRSQALGSSLPKVRSPAFSFCVLNPVASLQPRASLGQQREFALQAGGSSLQLNPILLELLRFCDSGRPASPCARTNI